LSWHQFSQRLLCFLRQDWASCLLFFVVGLVLRGVPELLVSWYPVGYETITYYAPAMFGMVGKNLGDVFLGSFGHGPLFYVLMWLAVSVFGAHPFVVLKVVGPLLYGCLGVSFFVFVQRGLRLEWKLAFVATLLLVFQVAALRESWDRFRTVLGLVFLFGGLTVLRSDDRYKWGLFGVFGLLTVLSREYVALVLFVSVLGFVILERKWWDGAHSLVALFPALCIFCVMVFPSLSVYWGGVVDAEFASRSYVWVVQDAFVIFMVCYLLLLPFVVSGLRGRRDWLVVSMLVWLLVGSFSVVGGPLFSVPGYQRWLMLLVFPLCVYAVWGFERLRLFSGRRVWFLVSVVLAFMVVGAGYSSGAFSFVGLMPNSYVAVNLVQSSIGWDQVDDVKAVLAWLDRNAAFNASVLVEERFYGWTRLYLDRANDDLAVIPYSAAAPPTLALEKALHFGYEPVYLIWFTERTVDGFVVIYSWNAVSVFEYVS
jgi:hypothetical protein